jgi:hypothetical protein
MKIGIGISLKSHEFCYDWCWSVTTLSLKLYQNYYIYGTVVYCTEHVHYVIHTVKCINLRAPANICHSAIRRITKHSTKIVKFCFTQPLRLHHGLLYSDIMQSAGSWLPGYQRNPLLPSSEYNCILKVLCGVNPNCYCHGDLKGLYMSAIEFVILCGILHLLSVSLFDEMSCVDKQ